MTPRVAIIGGGAAGFFLAIRLKERCPQFDVTILEKHQRVLRKVEISGGGRCNCTNTFAEVTDLRQVYPRGARLLKGLFREFGPEEARQWFEDHGVRLVVQEDQCIFPAAQDSHVIIDCFLRECQRLGIHIRTGVDGFQEALPAGQLAYDFVAVTTGGMSAAMQQHFLPQEIVTPLPSLFTFNIADEALKALMGTVVEASVSIPGTKLRSQGPLLITHWGMSGPAIIKLSSHAARLLAENNYHLPLSVNWCADVSTEELRQEIQGFAAGAAQRIVANIRPQALPSRLWEYLTQRIGIDATARRWGEVGPRQINRLVEVLTNDQYQIAGRCPFKEEFVTCGGIDLAAVDRHTLESRRQPHLYFAGEVLDIDGVTGGFNFQAAWTTADAVARAIAAQI